MTSRADMTAEGMSARVCHERARQLRGRLLGGRSVREHPEAGRARPADSDTERAGRCERVEPGPELGAQREGRGLQVVVEPGGELLSPGAGQGTERVGIEGVLAGAVQAIELGVDGRGRQAFVIREQHSGEGRQRRRLDPLAGALNERVLRLELARDIGPEVGGEPEELLVPLASVARFRISSAEEEPTFGFALPDPS
jgi:hypothetical protein